MLLGFGDWRIVCILLPERVNSVGIVVCIGLCVYLFCYCSLGTRGCAGFGDFVWLCLVFDLLVAGFVLWGCLCLRLFAGCCLLRLFAGLGLLVVGELICFCCLLGLCLLVFIA